MGFLFAGSLPGKIAAVLSNKATTQTMIFKTQERHQEISAEFKAAFEERLQEANNLGLRAAGILIAVLTLLFLILDWFIIPASFLFLLMMRTMMSLIALVIFSLTFTRFGKKNSSPLSVFLFSMTALCVVVMVHLHEGYKSPYYAGIMLVVLGAGVFMKWRVKYSCFTCLIIYVSYLIPCLFQEIQAVEILVSNSFFLLSTMIVVIVAQYSSLSLLRSEFYSRLNLNETKASLEEAYKKLQELDRLKSQFFSNITHELRTPLTLILSPLESILESGSGAFDKEQREYLKPIWKNALRLLKLINDLLDLTKLEDHFMRIRIEKNDLIFLLSDILEHSRPLAARKDIDLTMEVRSTRDDIWVDMEKMERVIVNLVSNALKFTEPGGKVNIWMESGEGELKIGVEDDGIGIPEELQAQVFERFSQADGSVSRHYGGTGIGLALVKEIVELHGGWITVDSKAGEGCLFVIHLQSGQGHFNTKILDRRKVEETPDARRRSEDRGPKEWTFQLLERKDYRFIDVAAATDRRVAERSDDNARATKVLVVEDNLDVLRFLNHQLSVEHSVYLAPDGVQGLELAKREMPDVIVTDYMMPEMDGLEMLRRIKADPQTAGIPVIMLTAKSKLEDRLEVREAGADEYLSKPFRPRELRSTVRQLLESQGRQASVVMREHVKSLEVISAGLAHEIHNPLSRIRSSFAVISKKLNKITETLQREDMEAAEKVKVVQSNLERMERMRQIAEQGIQRIKDVVKLVRRYAREGYPEEPAPIALDEMVQDVARLIAPDMEREVQIEVDPQAPGVTVRCIPEEMQQVIRNIWQNAVDATGEGGKVRVETRVDGPVVVFQVSDNGSGISHANIKRIFVPFFTTKDPNNGLGLGLAVAHQVVDRAGGVISVESIEGEGTTFEVKLPIAKAEVEMVAEPEDTAQAEPL